MLRANFTFERVVCVMLTMFFWTDAYADNVRGIFSRNVNPMAIRESVLLLPLGASTPGDHWPSTLTLTLSDKTPIQGQVIWIQADESFTSREWTDNPRRLLIREVFSSDNSTGLDVSSPEGPYLVARLPHDGGGPINLGQQVLSPQWMDTPLGMKWRDETLPTLPGRGAADLPDLDSPLEYWRWMILARKLIVNAPEGDFSPPEQLVAEHYAALWLVGMDRLRDADPGLANSCENLLTRICMDRQRPIAAWIAEPRMLGSLLSVLLDPNKTPELMIEEVALWANQHDPLIIWTEGEFPDYVRLGMINTSYQQTIARFTWIHTNDIPSAVPIEPGRLMHVRVERATTFDPDDGSPDQSRNQTANDQTQILMIEANNRQYQMPFNPPVIRAMPPGVQFPPFSMPLILGDLQARRQASVPEHHATLAHLRRREGHWEMFFECRRPNPQVLGKSVLIENLNTLSSYEEVRGIEAITLLIGPEAVEGGPRIALTIPEQGVYRLFAGGEQGMLQVHRRSYDDRWYCRIVIPDQWLLPDEGPYVLLAGLRSHYDLDQVESSPRAGLPWLISPGRLAIDLGVWTDRPEISSRDDE